MADYSLRPQEGRFGNSIVDVSRALHREMLYLSGVLTLFDKTRSLSLREEYEQEMTQIGYRLQALKTHLNLSGGIA